MVVLDVEAVQPYSSPEVVLNEEASFVIRGHLRCRWTCQDAPLKGLYIEGKLKESSLCWFTRLSSGMVMFMWQLNRIFRLSALLRKLS